MTQEEAKPFIAILDSYKEKCSIIKQIHSNKKDLYDTCTTTFNIITIIASLVLTIVGFTNKDLLYELFMKSGDKVLSLKFFDFAFNSAVLFVLIISILNLIFRFQDKAFEHNKAIILFSNILRDVNEVKVVILSLNENNANDKVSQISFKYSSIIDLIPSHSDNDFFKAKRDYYKKKNKSKKIDKEYNSNNDNAQ